MRKTTIIACAAFAWLGCDPPGVPMKPAETSGAAKPAVAASGDSRAGEDTRLDKLVAHLQRVSSSAQMQKDKAVDPSKLVFARAVDADGKVATGPRGALSFHFESVPYKEGMPGGEDGFAALSAKLDVDASRTVVIAMAFTGKTVDLEDAGGTEASADKAPTRYESVRILVARDAKDESSNVGRAAVAKLWNLTEKADAPYERAAFDAIVLGTRLKRNTSPPSFSDLGSGSWTLLRLVEPGGAYLAIDWASGVGEFIPKAEGVRADAGLALFKAF